MLQVVHSDESTCTIHDSAAGRVDLALSRCLASYSRNIRTLGPVIFHLIEFESSLIMWIQIKYSSQDGLLVIILFVAAESESAAAAAAAAAHAEASSKTETSRWSSETSS
jgi:hypothetical protein